MVCLLVFDGIIFIYERLLFSAALPAPRDGLRRRPSAAAPTLPREEAALFSFKKIKSAALLRRD